VRIRVENIRYIIDTLLDVTCEDFHLRLKLGEKINNTFHMMTKHVCLCTFQVQHVTNRSCRKIGNTHFVPHMISLKIVHFQTLLNKWVRMFMNVTLKSLSSYLLHFFIYYSTFLQKDLNNNYVIRKKEGKACKPLFYLPDLSDITGNLHSKYRHWPAVTVSPQHLL
jgi:hypothetical protein